MATLKDANGYTTITTESDGVYLTVFPPSGKGSRVTLDQVNSELQKKNMLVDDPSVINQAVIQASGRPQKILNRINDGSQEQVFVEISDDDMLAKITVVPPQRESDHFTNIDDVRNALKRRNVVYGVDEGRMAELSAKLNQLETSKNINEPVEMDIAFGTPTTNGEDARIEYLYKKTEETTQPPIPEESEDGRIDYRAVHKIDNITKGTILARKNPPTKGMSGMTVTGKTLAAVDGKDIDVTMGKGVVASPENKDEWIADTDGQVIIKENKISVLALYEIPGDVNLSTGNIDFIGTVIVRGDVKDGFKVYAGEDLIVNGVVEGAELKCNGKLSIAGGVSGNDKAKIFCSGDANIKYIRNAIVEITGRKLAREYATERPSVIRVNYGIQRSERGGMSMRAVTMLPCLIGSWKEIGGGLQLSLSGSFGLNKKALEMPELMEKALGRPARIVNMVQLGTALNSLDSPPIRALFVYNSNPAAVCPNHNEVIRGLKRTDLFTVVHEQFFTDTTDYADIVLPATTFFEHKDLQTAYGHYYLHVSHQAMEPMGECRSNVELFRALAGRMGLAEECFRETVDSMIDSALDSPNPWLQGITRDRLEREHRIRLNFSDDGNGTSHVATDTPVRPTRQSLAEGDSAEVAPFLPFAHGNFPTPSGKAEFYSESLKALGLDPVVAYAPPEESRHGAKATAFPLELLARKPDNHLNSTFSNVPSVRQKEPWMGKLEMHPIDAQARGIRVGDSVRVFNLRGEIVLHAMVDGSVPAGVVAARLDWACFSPGGRNINVLTSEKLADMGNAATFYSVCVEVELFRA